jgi:ADP-ribose pyrophosphatase YjhB (NUDIX family)
LAPAVPNAIIHTRGRWVDMVFEVSVPASGSLAIDEAEVHEAAWYPLDDLPRLTTPTARLLAHYGIGPLRDDPRDD